MSVHHSPLGQSTPYVQDYDAALLFPIARATNRAELKSAVRPAHGVDIWTAYELSWLNTKGKPVVAAATFVLPATSPHIIESKSFKLYLNSFNQTRFASTDEVLSTLRHDLSQASGAPVDVTLHTQDTFADMQMAEMVGDCLDELDIEITAYEPDAELLKDACAARGTPAGASSITETLVSHLLKSNCPVTSQPDWATLQIRYTGAPIDHEKLLRYIVSYRQHAGFHEHCVEQIFDDISRYCSPDALTVYARYTRRGGLDINPWRSTLDEAPEVNIRTARQ